jgi:Leucine-rich repeat (LRR) protein
MDTIKENKPEEILEIEKIYDIALNENSYVLNDKHEIIELSLRNHGIKEIKGLEKLAQLQVLDLQENQISEIKGLGMLIQLKKLRIDYNQIRSILSFQSLIQIKTLKYLNMKNNPTEDFPVFKRKKNHLKEVKTYLSKS